MKRAYKPNAVVKWGSARSMANALENVVPAKDFSNTYGESWCLQKDGSNLTISAELILAFAMLSRHGDTYFIKLADNDRDAPFSQLAEFCGIDSAYEVKYTTDPDGRAPLIPVKLFKGTIVQQQDGTRVDASYLPSMVGKAVRVMLKPSAWVSLQDIPTAEDDTVNPPRLSIGFHCTFLQVLADEEEIDGGNGEPAKPKVKRAKVKAEEPAAEKSEEGSAENGAKEAAPSEEQAAA